MTFSVRGGVLGYLNTGRRNVNVLMRNESGELAQDYAIFTG